MGSREEFSVWAHGVASRMAEALERNAHKGGRDNWLKDEPLRLAYRVYDELEALLVVLSGDASADVVWKKAASVANMAAMAADAYAAQQNSGKALENSTPPT